MNFKKKKLLQTQKQIRLLSTQCLPYFSPFFAEKECHTHLLFNCIENITMKSNGRKIIRISHPLGKLFKKKNSIEKYSTNAIKIG